MSKDLLTICSMLKHRGPDNETIFVDNQMNTSMVFTRLAIQDLSVEATQPFFSSDKQTYILFNGEVYNKDYLLGLLPHSFKAKSTSDTEIILNCILHLGIKKTLNQTQGMFSFILMDRRTKTIQVVRDRFGIKPMYYINEGKNKFKFSSEIKILANLVDLTLDYEMLREFAICGLLDHTENTMFTQIKKIAPGSIFTIANGRFFEESWVEKASFTSDLVSPAEVHTKLEELVKISIKDAMVSDVPVGINISSGIDSNLIRVLAKKEIRDVSLHTVTWGERQFSEYHVLQKYLGHDNNLVVHEFNASQVYDLILDSFKVHDEPYSSPFVAVWPEVYRNIKAQGTSVILDGTGADELFFGYSKYLSHTFTDYSLRALDGVKIGLDFKSKFDYNPLNIVQANDYDTFNIKLPRSLRFLDSSSMSASVEVRPVFLTNALYELSRAIPINLMLTNNITKYPLRILLSKIETKFPAFLPKKDIQEPSFKWLTQDWREEIVKQIRNIDSLLDLIPHASEKASLLNVKDNFCTNTGTQNIPTIWRIFNINLWLNSK